MSKQSSLIVYVTIFGKINMAFFFFINISSEIVFIFHCILSLVTFSRRLLICFSQEEELLMPSMVTLSLMKEQKYILSPSSLLYLFHKGLTETERFR